MLKKIKRKPMIKQKIEKKDSYKNSNKKSLNKTDQIDENSEQFSQQNEQNQIHNTTSIQPLILAQKSLHSSLLLQQSNLIKQLFTSTIHSSQQILQLLTNILISQLNQQNITYQIYTKIIEFIKYQQIKLKEVKDSVKILIEVNNLNNGMNFLKKDDIVKMGETEFITIVKDLLRITAMNRPSSINLSISPINNINNMNNTSLSKQTNIKIFIQFIYKIVIDLIAKQQLKYLNQAFKTTLQTSHPFISPTIPLIQHNIQMNQVQKQINSNLISNKSMNINVNLNGYKNNNKQKQQIYLVKSHSQAKRKIKRNLIQVMMIFSIYHQDFNDFFSRIKIFCGFYYM